MTASVAIQVLPKTDSDEELCRIVDEVIAYIAGTGLRYEVGAYETTIESTDYDQLIMETSNGRDFWIHVSCRKNKRKNRHQVLRLSKK